MDTNHGLTALAAGINVAAGVSQSFPLGSSGSRTAVNIRLGGRTQVVGLVQATGVAVVLLFLTGALALLPKATLGAVIIYAALGLMDIGAWAAFARGSRGELVVAVITVIGMLTIGLLPALILAVLAVLDPRRDPAQRPTARRRPRLEPHHRPILDVERHRDAVVFPGVIIYRLDDRLFFANSRYFRSRVREAVRGAPYPVTTLIFDAESVSDLDTSGAQALADLVYQLKDDGIRFAWPGRGPRSRNSSAEPGRITSPPPRTVSPRSGSRDLGRWCRPGDRGRVDRGSARCRFGPLCGAVLRRRNRSGAGAGG